MYTRTMRQLQFESREEAARVVSRQLAYTPDTHATLTEVERQAFAQARTLFRQGYYLSAREAFHGAGEHASTRNPLLAAILDTPFGEQRWFDIENHILPMYSECSEVEDVELANKGVRSQTLYNAGICEVDSEASLCVDARIGESLPDDEQLLRNGADYIDQLERDIQNAPSAQQARQRFLLMTMAVSDYAPACVRARRHLVHHILQEGFEATDEGHDVIDEAIRHLQVIQRVEINLSGFCVDKDGLPFHAASALCEELLLRMFSPHRQENARLLKAMLRHLETGMHIRACSDKTFTLQEWREVVEMELEWRLHRCTVVQERLSELVSDRNKSKLFLRYTALLMLYRTGRFTEYQMLARLRALQAEELYACAHPILPFCVSRDLLHFQKLLEEEAMKEPVSDATAAQTI